MYRLRFFWMILLSLFQKPKKITDTFILNFRIIPFIDTDFTRMFTHSYALLMGLARWHYVFSSEIRRVALKYKWAPVTTAETIEYMKSVKAFSKVRLETKLLTWDERRFYLEHSFWVGKELKVKCLLEGLIRSPEGIKKPGAVFAATGLEEEAKPFSEELKQWVLFLKK